MANSRDPRRPTRWHRGDKRYGNVGGHSPPGDDLENTRDHERIWFELRRTRGCCGCEHPGIKVCFETADYPTLVCEGLYPASLSLVDYYPGNPYSGGTGTDMTLGQGCGGTGHTQVEGFSTATDFEPDGSWRNGPIFGKRGFGGNATFLGTSAPWDSAASWMDISHSVEFFVKPSSTDLALSKSLTASGPFMNLGDGGYFTYFAPSGRIAFSHIAMDPTTVYSPVGTLIADEWHHVVYVRNVDDLSFSIFVNGRRVIYAPLPLTTDFTFNPDALFTFSGGENSWFSDLSRYNGAMPASEVRRRARVMLGIVGLPDGAEDEEGGDGTIVEDPTFLIEDLDPSQINGGDAAGNVMMSTAESAYWETPEGSPFELEERKGQADGYASLDGTTKVPTAELATGTADQTSFLRGDRQWIEGQIVPAPEDTRQVLISGPDTSVEFLAAIAANPNAASRRWPLTESGSGPFLDSGGANGWTNVGTPVANSDFPPAFDGETCVQFESGDGLSRAGSFDAFVDPNNWGCAFWLWIDELPGSSVNLVQNGSSGDGMQLRLRSDGKLEFYRADTAWGPQVGATVLETGQWYFVSFVYDSSGAGTRLGIWVDGAVDLSMAGGGYALNIAAASAVAGDGFVGRMAHLTLFHQPNSTSTAQWLAMFGERVPAWFPRPQTDLEIQGGIEASEDGVDVTAAARGRVDFIPGANVTVDVVDDDVNDVIEVTIAATSPAGSGIEASEEGVDVSASPRGRLNFLNGFGTYWDLTDDGANDEVEIVVNLPDASGASVGDVLTLDSGSEPAWETPSGGGGGGGGWDAVLDIPLTSLTDWTGDSGTWTTDGTKILGTGANPARVRYTADIPLAGAVVECEINLPSLAGTAYGGIIWGWDGTGNTGVAVRLQVAAGVTAISVENLATAAYATFTTALVAATWYTLRCYFGGGVVTIWLDGALIGSSGYVGAVNNAKTFVGFTAGDAGKTNEFRNLKVWTPTMP